ncbi:hypothetical protein Clacol_003503 [Clathrus columnatus]|uniref:Uncharacterized protein n=1 Tax=Clathrus columnatus TaxID=1419009 RepID=A0AAV5A8D7_9AGAM|nr:hypothetical protein Clacol_003503 [Clathrus columnatus]
MKYTLFVPLLLTLLRDFSGAVLVNNTFDDTNPAIIYEPTSAWFSTPSIVCPLCPNPTMISYHYGSHFVPPDLDDQPPANAAVNPSDPDAGPNDPDSGEHSGKGKGGGKGGSGRRSLFIRDDIDDSGFVDVPVNATFTFNGTGVYVYCNVPTQANGNVSNPLHSNITFTIDGQRGKPFVLTPPNGPTPLFNLSQLVFESSGLSDGQHELIISPQLQSMIMLDTIVVTTDTDAVTSSQNGTSTDSNPSASSGTAMKPATKKNAETFAIAIGSTTGVLAVLSFIVAVNLYLRRRRSAKREKIREAQEESLRPEMRGPQPFIPRFFPGTIVSQTSGTSTTTASATQSVSRRSSQSSMGPSHGLNYPLAPEIPAYSPPTSVISEVPRPLPVSIALRAPVVRLPDDDDTALPPSYQEVGQTTLLSIPVFGAQSGPAPSFTQLSPTQHPLILSSEPTTSEGDDDAELTPISSISNIPMILVDDDDENTLLGQAGSTMPRRSRSNNGDGPR